MKQHGALTTHLLEAIRLNKQRRGYYATQTAGRSRWLSRLLINSERFSLPLAAWIDGRARKFQDRGIPIVADDFVSMDGVAAASEPPRNGRVASPTHFKKGRQLVRQLRCDLKRHSARFAFSEAAAATIIALDAVAELEASSGAHFAMTRHIIESVGLTAINGVRYAAMSGGATGRLTRLGIKTHQMALTSALVFDRIAQELHAIGCGILVNDVPDIPFRQTWQSHVSAT